MKSLRLNLATVVFIAAIVVATALVTVILRNPASRVDLEDPAFYERTEIALLQQDYVYQGYGIGAGLLESGADPHLVGKALYVRTGCVGCHGIFGEGAVVGPILWGMSEEEAGDFIRDVRDGPGGMPPYPDTYLSDEDLGLILVFLEAAPSDAAALGVTTTTTTTTTTLPPATTTTVVGGPTTTAPREALILEAPTASIVVDGETSEWEAIEGLDLVLQPIVGEAALPLRASIKVAHDDAYVYVLFTVEDDFNWSDIDPHFSGAPAVMWAVEQAAGPHMGGEDESGHPGLGLVDIWYWRLDCPAGAEQGGAVHGPGSGDPGNDGTCNFDDEWATDPETQGDDAGSDAENSLLGVFTHSAQAEDADGTWFFEMSRPLQTGDPQDAQFAIGGRALLALAYWDPDAGQNGWGPRNHVQSSNLGWINVMFVE